MTVHSIALRVPRVSVAGFVGALAGVALRAHSVARQRRQLAELDGRLLRDIGVSSAAAQAEARRPFWELP